MRNWVLCWLLIAGPALAAPELSVERTRSYTHPKLQMTVIGGEAELPADGIWESVQPPSDAPVTDISLTPPQEMLEQRRGKTMARLDRERKVEMGRWSTLRWYQPIRAFAHAHNGLGPSSFDGLFESNKGPSLASSRKSLMQSPWPEDRSAGHQGPFFFLIPDVPIPERSSGSASAQEARPLVLELRPYVADGKHWVLFADGRCERVPIDRELVKKYGLTVSPVLPGEAEVKAAAPRVWHYRITGLLRRAVREPVKLGLRNSATDRALALVWDPRDAAAGGEDLMTRWAQGRLLRWMPMLLEPDSTILQVWASRLGALYGMPQSPLRSLLAAAERTARTTDVLNVLGGRAAVRETLQTQAIATTAGAREEQQSIPIETIGGVQVKSHPFEEMLKGSPGGNLPLADVVPHDRLFVYFARPSALVGFLEGGGEMLARAGSALTRNSVDDGLESRYLGRLGLNGGWAREFLRHGVVTELAVVLPDLFLIDGTEITVIMRAPLMSLARPMLALLGVSGLDKGSPVAVRLKSGEVAYWAARGDMLLVSTHPRELERVIELYSQGGKGSLGRSAELRYMLTRLPIQKDTVGYAYLSDPFIRNLVSPATKIAQLRRLRARADLQAIMAGALLYIADGQPGTPTLTRLAELGYVPASLAQGDYTLGEDLVARSQRYGTLARPASLLVDPVTHATRAEADAYKRYLDGYHRFWRQFFDPIAMRLDETGAGSFELSTFILPLVESELYNQVRRVVTAAEKGKPLKVPRLGRQPVLMLSLNLTPETWLDIAKNLESLFRHYSGIDTEILDYLGPSLHLAIADSDPIIALGSGNIAGAFGADATMMRGDWMLLAPIALSVLTRPSTLAVELSDPQKVLAILKRGGITVMSPGRSDFLGRLQKISGRDAWVYSIGIDAIRLSLGIEVQGDYLLITNLPWTQKPTLTTVAPAALNGALLELDPAAAQQQLPALYASAVGQERAAAMQGIGYLYPLLASVSKTPEEAAAAHARLFGFMPLHPAGGEWVWKDGVLTSSVFGTPARQTQPDYPAGKRDFGLLPGDLERLSVNMQFEEAGLRTSARWSLQAR